MHDNFMARTHKRKKRQTTTTTSTSTSLAAFASRMLAEEMEEQKIKKNRCVEKRAAPCARQVKYQESSAAINSLNFLIEIEEGKGKKTNTEVNTTKTGCRRREIKHE